METTINQILLHRVEPGTKTNPGKFVITMEAKLKEIIELVKDSTEKKTIQWKLLQPYKNNNMLHAKLGVYEVRLKKTEENISFQLIEGRTSVASFAEERGAEPSMNLFDTFEKAQKQAIGIEEKLDDVIELLKKINNSED